jgi:hypothetical protein
MPITAIQVGANEWFRSRVFHHQPTPMQQVGSAFTAGVLSSFISCPVERIMILQNEHPQSSFPYLLSRKLKLKGFSGLFVGQFATSLREGGFATFFLAAPPVIKSNLQQHGWGDGSSSIIAGVTSGVLATLATQPVDTIKTIQQSAMDTSLGFFKVAGNMAKNTWFKGIVARSSSLIIGITLMDWVKGRLENLCEVHGESFYGRLGLRS